MLEKQKKLIIDKDIFRGTSTSKLKEFAENYFLILPQVLYYECITANERREKLLDRFRMIILAGGYICPTCNDILRWEAKNLFPYGSLIDLEEVAEVKRVFEVNDRPYNPEHITKLQYNVLEFVGNIRSNTESFNEQLILEDPELLSEVRKWDSSRASKYERFRKWAELVDTNDIHTAACHCLRGLARELDKYCLSDEWVSWEYLRLMLIHFYEKTFLTHKGAKFSEHGIEHDLQDIKYVLLLSRADGLLTKDNELIKPLAKAVFPEKDVFSNLEEVPDTYKCYWK